MTTTIGAMKQMSDQPGTVRAAVLLTSDKSLPNPLSEISTPLAISQIYAILGLSKEYFISNVFLIQVTSNLGVYGYSFDVKFAKAGIKLTVSVGPKGDPGSDGPAGPRGNVGPAGPPSPPSGAAGGDLSGTYPSPTVAKIRGTDIDGTAPTNGQLLTYVGADGKWEPKDPPAGVTFTAVKNALAVASSSVSFNSQKITGVTDPGDPQDVATKHYADGLAQGLDLKPSVMAVEIGELTSLAGLTTTVDDVLLDTGGMRVLLTGQGTVVGSWIDNGIWVVNSGAWTRPTDFATGSHVAAAYTFIQEGTLRAHTGWVCMNDVPNDVVGTNGLTFTQFSAAGTITFGGDLSGTSGSQNVIRIQNYDVNNATPTEGQTFVWHSTIMSGSWTPIDLGRVSTVIMPMVAGLQYANNTVYSVLGSSFNFSSVSLGYGTATAKFNFVINVPAGSTAKVQVYDATNATTIWESGTYTGPLSGYEINQTIALASGYARYEHWQVTPVNTGGASTCMHSSISVSYATDFGGPVG